MYGLNSTQMIARDNNFRNRRPYLNKIVDEPADIVVL